MIKILNILRHLNSCSTYISFSNTPLQRFRQK